MMFRKVDLKVKAMAMAMAMVTTTMTTAVATAVETETLADYYDRPIYLVDDASDLGGRPPEVGEVLKRAPNMAYAVFMDPQCTSTAPFYLEGEMLAIIEEDTGPSYRIKIPSQLDRYYYLPKGGGPAVSVLLPDSIGILGDANKDGVVDSTDASSILALYAHYATTPGAKDPYDYMSYGVIDYNGDTIVDSADASEILKTYAEISVGTGYERYVSSDGVFVKLPAGRTISGIAVQEQIPLAKLLEMNAQIPDPNQVMAKTPIYLKKFVPEDLVIPPTVATTTTATTVQTTTASTTMTTTAPEPVTEIEDGLNYQLNYPYAESWALYADEECTIPVRWMNLQEKIAFWAIPGKKGKYKCYVTGTYPNFENPGEYYTQIYDGNEYKFKVYVW